MEITADLTAWPMVRLLILTDGADWDFVGPDGIGQRVTPEPKLSASTNSVAPGGVLAGDGWRCRPTIWWQK